MCVVLVFAVADATNILPSRQFLSRFDLRLYCGVPSPRFCRPQRFGIDMAALEASFKRMQRAIHPDLFGQKSPKEQSLSADASSQVNAAYRILRAPATRAQYLLQLHGIDAIGEGAGSGSGFCDPALLMEIMEARETLADAADAARRAQAKLKELAAKSSGASSSTSSRSDIGHVHGPGCGHEGYEGSETAAEASHVHGPGCGHPEHEHRAPAAGISSAPASSASNAGLGKGKGSTRRAAADPEASAAQAALQRARSTVLALDKDTAAQLRDTVAELERAFDSAGTGRDLDAAARQTVRLQYLTKLSNEVDDWLEAYGRAAASPSAAAASASSGVSGTPGDASCAPGAAGGSAVSRLAEQILSEKAPQRQSTKAKAGSTGS